MRKSFAVFFLFLTCGVVLAFAQDDKSLGDAARQARQQKQQKATHVKDDPGKDGSSAETPKVFTDEEIPERPSSTAPSLGGDQPRKLSVSPSPVGGKMSPERWKSRIQAQKYVIASLRSEINKLNDSMNFAPANCGANCAQWNQRQREKQQAVERVQAQLEDQKKRLEDMQETARQQGYGSSVYDP